MRTLRTGLLATLALFPVAALAAPRTYPELVRMFVSIINLIIPVIITFALVAFLYGVAKYILSLGNEEHKSEGRVIMLWGIIGIFVMVAIWGILQLIAGTFFGGGFSTLGTSGLEPGPYDFGDHVINQTKEIIWQF